MKREIEILQQTEECLGLRDAGRVKEGSFPKVLRALWAFYHLEFEILASRTERINVWYLVCDTLLWQP